MRAPILCLLIFLSFPLVVTAQIWEYKDATDSVFINEVDSLLLKDATAVLHDYFMKVEVQSLEKVKIKEYYVLTVLSEKGNEHAVYRGYTNPMYRLKKATGWLYDDNGKQLRKIRTDNFVVRASSPGAAFYDDSKDVHFDFKHRKYPYTVVFETVTEQNNTFFLPGFYSQPDKEVAVKRARMQVIAPIDFKLRYKLFNTTEPEKITQAAQHVYQWEAANINAWKAEPLSWFETPVTPVVYLAASDFQIENYKGKMQTWKEYGKFSYELNKDRDILPKKEAEHIKTLVADIAEKKEKIRRLYKYMQDNTRYVAIEYGISGWQTMDASFLAENKYGDCKALSNYMMAMLKATDITSYPAIIYAGKNNNKNELEDFPSTQFNHVILCVPDGKDTVWLECTSRDLPANYLGDFTEDRHALLITPEGGVVVHTPVYGPEDNRIIRNVAVDFAEGNLLNVAVKNLYYGAPGMSLHHKVNNVPQHEVKEYINSKFDYPGYEVKEYRYNRQDLTKGLELEEDVVMEVKNMYQVSSSRIFLNANITSLNLPSYVMTEERKTPFKVHNGVSIIDTVSISLPEGTIIESLPKVLELKNDFGEFTYKVQPEEGKIIILRKFIQYGGVYNAKKFENYVKWLDEVNKTDKQKIVLKKT